MILNKCIEHFGLVVDDSISIVYATQSISNLHVCQRFDPSSGVIFKEKIKIFTLFVHLTIFKRHQVRCILDDVWALVSSDNTIVWC